MTSDAIALESLRAVKKVIGVKQALRAVEKNVADMVYLAEDADKRVTAPLKDASLRNGVAVKLAPSMEELGKACGIAVGAAAVAVLR